MSDVTLVHSVETTVVSTSVANIAAVAGGTAGGIVAGMIIAVLVLHLRWRFRVRGRKRVLALPDASAARVGLERMDDSTPAAGRALIPVLPPLPPLPREDPLNIVAVSTSEAAAAPELYDYAERTFNRATDLFMALRAATARHRVRTAILDLGGGALSPPEVGAFVRPEETALAARMIEATLPTELGGNGAGSSGQDGGGGGQEGQEGGGGGPQHPTREQAVLEFEQTAIAHGADVRCVSSCLYSSEKTHKIKPYFVSSFSF
jgi:hypothetical protein